MKKYNFTLIVVLAMATMMFASCTKEDNLLVGTWEMKNPSTYYGDYINTRTFSSNGNYTERVIQSEGMYSEGYNSTYKGTYSYDEDSRILVMSISEINGESHYSTRTRYVHTLTETKLVLLDLSDGTSMTFTKK